MRLVHTHIHRWCNENNDFCSKRANTCLHTGVGPCVELQKSGGWFYERGDHAGAIFHEGCTEGTTHSEIDSLQQETCMK
jgi:hypothetical protein